MNLSKAIELNQDSAKSLRDHKFPDHADAIKLGNEALKILQRSRKPHDTTFTGLLPGETDE